MGLFGPRYADGQVVDLGGLPIRLRISGRARRVSLRVDRARGEAVAVNDVHFHPVEPLAVRFTLAKAF